MRTYLGHCARLWSQVGLPSRQGSAAVAIVAAMLAAVPTGAFAAAIVGPASNVTGISGLTIGTVTYDVSFSASSYNATFGSAGPTFFGNPADAFAAATAMAVLFVDDDVTGVAGGDCITKPPGIVDFFHCNIIVPTSSLTGAWLNHAVFPNGAVSDWRANPAGTIGFSADANQGLLIGNPNYQAGSGGYHHFAVFTAQPGATVPEPSSLALAGLCLAGLALRRKSKLASREP